MTAAAALLPLRRRPNLLIFALASSAAGVLALLWPAALVLASFAGVSSDEATRGAAAMAAMDEADCLLGARDSSPVASLATALALTLYEGLERLLMPALPSLAVLTDGCAPDSAARATRPAVGGSAPERMRVRTPGVQRSWARRSDALSRALICLEQIRHQSIMGPGARARNSQAQGCMRCPGSEHALLRTLLPAQQKQTPGPRNRSPSDLDTSRSLRCIVR